jgi:hypothetical protein
VRPTAKRIQKAFLFILKLKSRCLTSYTDEKRGWSSGFIGGHLGSASETVLPRGTLGTENFASF